MRRPRGTQGGSLQRYIRITDVACRWGEETQFLEGSSSFTTSEMNELQEDEMSSYIFFSIQGANVCAVEGVHMYEPLKADPTTCSHC